MATNKEKDPETDKQDRKSEIIVTGNGYSKSGYGEDIFKLAYHLYMVYNLRNSYLWIVSTFYYMTLMKKYMY